MDLKEYKKRTGIIKFCLNAIYLLFLVFIFSSLVFKYTNHNSIIEKNHFKSIFNGVLGTFLILIVYNSIKIIKAALGVLIYAILKNKDKLL